LTQSNRVPRRHSVRRELSAAARIDRSSREVDESLGFIAIIEYSRASLGNCAHLHEKIQKNGK